MGSTDEQEELDEQDDGMSFTRFMGIAVGAVIGVVVLIFLAGIGLAVFTEPQQTASRLKIIQDVLVIIMIFEGLLIVIALVVLILQATRLTVMLRNESSPVWQHARETVEILKGTAQFASKNFVRPIISLNAAITMFFAFIREFGGIRRAIRPKRRKDAPEK